MDEINPFDAPDMIEPPVSRNPFDDPEMVEQTAEQGRVATLPMPTENMFADMDDADAKSVYDAYSRHPESQVDQETGGVIYKGVPVPAPEGNPGWMGALGKVGSAIAGAGPAQIADSIFGTNISGVTDAAGDALAGGIVNAGRNIAVGGAALVEALPMPGAELSETVPGTQDLSVTLDETLPKFNPEGTVEHIGSQLTEIGAGLLLGNKTLAILQAKGVAGPVLQSMKSKFPTAVKYLSEKFMSAVAGSVGTAATVDGASDTLVVGRNPTWDSLQKSFPILKGLQNADPGTAQRILEDRMNVLLDSMLIALPVETVADGGKTIFRTLYKKFLKPLQGVFDANKRSQQIMDSLMASVDEVVNAGGTDPAKGEFWKNKIVEILRDPDSKIAIGISKEGVEDVDITLDTASALRRGIEKIDPNAAGNELYDPESADAVKRLFTESGNAVVDSTGTTGQTAISMERSARELDKLTKEASGAYGGEQIIDRSRESLQDIGERKVAEAVRGDPTSVNQIRLTKQGDEFTRSLSEQSDLGSKIVQAKDEPFSSTGVERNKLVKEMLEAEETGSTAVKSESDRLLESISDKTQPRASLEENLGKAVEGIDYLSPEIKKILKESGTGLDEETDEFVIGNFKMLQRLREPLKREIEKLRLEKSPGAGILQNILDDISDTKSNVGKGALKKYVQFEEGTTGPMTRQGLPKELSDIRSTAKIEGDAVKGKKQQFVKLVGELSSDQPETISHLADVLSDTRYGKSHGKISEYIYTDVVDQLRQQIKDSPLPEIDTGPVLAALKKFRQALTNEKFSGVLKKIDDFEALVKEHKGNKKALEAVLKTKVGDPTAMKNEIFKEILGDFFTTNGVRNPNGYESFKRLFQNRQATGIKEAGRLDKLIDLADKENPLILDGMKAAYINHFRDEIITIRNAKREVSPEKASEFLTREYSSLKAIGQKLFKEGKDRELFNAIQVVLKPALDVTFAQKGGRLNMEAVSEAAKDARSSVSQMVRFIYGPLTRIGTATGALTQNILEGIRPAEYALKIADAMFADPKGFLTALDKSAKVWEKRNGREMRDVVQWLVKSGVYDQAEANKFQDKLRETGEEGQTEELFGAKKKGFLERGQEFLKETEENFK